MKTFAATLLRIILSFPIFAQDDGLAMKLGAYYFEGWAGKCPYDDGNYLKAIRRVVMGK